MLNNPPYLQCILDSTCIHKCIYTYLHANICCCIQTHLYNLKAFGINQKPIKLKNSRTDHWYWLFTHGTGCHHPHIRWQNLVHTSQSLYCISYLISNFFILYSVFCLFYVFLIPQELAVSLAPCQIAIWQNLFALLSSKVHRWLNNVSPPPPPGYNIQHKMKWMNIIAIPLRCDIHQCRNFSRLKHGVSSWTGFFPGCAVFVCFLCVKLEWHKRCVLC